MKMVSHIGTLYDRVKKLLVSDEWTDCCFSVSDRKFKAHKLILSTCSPVFQAMFYGPLSNDDEIVITDIYPEIFQLMLNYIYTDSIDFSSLDGAFELLYVSKKYLLENLTKLCIDYIQTNISADNITMVLNYPEAMLDEKIYFFALNSFCQHASFYFSQSKGSISLTSLKNILSREKLNIHEKALIKHTFEWIKVYCVENNMLDDLETRRNFAIKNGILQLLRFLSLSPNDIDDIISDSNNILLKNEYESIVSMLSNKTEINTLTHINSLPPRQILDIEYYYIRRSPVRSVPPRIIDFNNLSIKCKVKPDRSVFIKTVYIPTRMGHSVSFNYNNREYIETVNLSIFCESNNKLISKINFIDKVQYDSVSSIDLSEPCFLKKGEWYRFDFTWSNKNCFYVYNVQIRDCIGKDHHVKFEFHDYSCSLKFVGSFLIGLKYSI